MAGFGCNVTATTELPLVLLRAVCDMCTHIRCQCYLQVVGVGRIKACTFSPHAHPYGGGIASGGGGGGGGGASAVAIVASI